MSLEYQGDKQANRKNGPGGNQGKSARFWGWRSSFFLPASLKEFSHLSYTLLMLGSHENAKSKQLRKILKFEKTFAILYSDRG